MENDIEKIEDKLAKMREEYKNASDSYKKFLLSGAMILKKRLEELKKDKVDTDKDSC